jgi:curli biogenesis system outer membrane secretion channel CsgG
MNSKRNLFILFVILAQALAACASVAAQTAVAAEPTAAPPPAPTATPEPAVADPTEVVQSFWNAMEAGDLDAAMALVASDAKCRGSCYFGGEQSFRSYLQGIVNSGATTNISDLQVEGDKVSYFWELLRNGNLQETGNESMQVQNGKIVLWENVHP